MYKELVKHQQLKFEELRARSGSNGKKKYRRRTKSRENRNGQMASVNLSQNLVVNALPESGINKVN